MNYLSLIPSIDYPKSLVVGRYLTFNGCVGTLKSIRQEIYTGQPYSHHYWCDAFYLRDRDSEFWDIDWQLARNNVARFKDDIKNKEKWNKIIDCIENDDYVHLSVIECLVAQKMYIRRLSNSRHASIRQMVAYYGLSLHKLVSDEHSGVRCAVAGRGYGLNRLVFDESMYVRIEVAKHGYGLDILIKDKLTDVRCQVAKQGYGLDILLHDKSPYVRAEVARQGYGLDVLKNDKSRIVQKVIAEILSK